MQKFKSVLVYLLVFTLIFGSSISSFATPLLGLEMNGKSNQTKELVGGLKDPQLEAYKSIKSYNSLSGLIGFEDDYKLDKGDEIVSVIVLFKNQPAATAQVDAAFSKGKYLSLAEAEGLVEKDHVQFNKDLESLFKGSEPSLASIHAGYRIRREYRKALNGVSMEISPALLEKLLEFDSVQAIFPNIEVETLPIDKTRLQASGDQSGMAEGREAMNVDQLHEEGIRGEGITVCVIDTGIDYEHPDFEGAFLTESPSGRAEELKDGFFYGRNFLVDFDKENFPGYPGREANDPMETTYDEIWGNEGSKYATGHGTHVAGSIAARDKNPGDVSALGVAPEAKIYAYRVLGPAGRGSNDAVLDAIEQVVYDRPDVVNMSLGASINDAFYPTSLAINNIVINNPDITFVVAAGNDGPNAATVGSPGTAATAITVANGSVAQEGFLLFMGVGNGFFNTSIFYLDKESEFLFDEESFKYYSNYEDLVSVEGTDHGYEVIQMPKLSLEVDGALPDLGTGTKEEFDSLGDAIAGKLVLVARGSEFVKTAEYAKAYGAGGVILLDRMGENLGLEYRGRDKDYLPFFIIDYFAGLDFLNELNMNDNIIYFNDFMETTIPSMVNETSSRGPVMPTYEIKPDIISHGTDVLSTVPYFLAPNEEGIYDGGTEGDYSNAYDRYSGTSMASPHVAGVAALLKQYSLKTEGAKWDADVIKARIMNTARPLGQDYGVNEIGGGLVDAYRAVHSEIYVTVAKDDVPIDGSKANEKKFDTGSMSFGLASIGEDTEATIKSRYGSIHNKSKTEKTFDLTYRFNSAGQNVRDVDLTDIELNLSRDKIKVAAGGREDFSATLSVPTNMDSGLAGYYEGYVILTNTDDPQESYSLPFMINCLYLSDILEEGNYFINKPVISTGRDRQGELSSSFDFYFKQSQPGYYSFEIYANDASYDLDNLKDSNWLGFLDADINAFYEGTHNWVYQTISDGTYMGMNASGTDYEAKTFKEGHYKLVITANSESFDYPYVYDLDLIVDNKIPQVEINELETGDYDSIYIEENATSLSITGNVYDDTIDYLKENNLEFEIWEEGDEMPRTPDQGYNAVVLILAGQSHRAKVDGRGNFSLNVDLDNITLPARARLYAMDSFSIRDITSYSGESTKGFDPSMPSYTFNSGLAKFGYIGSNIVAKDFYLESQGANIRLTPEDINMFVGDSKEIQVLFNKAAANDRIAYYESSDPEVVTVKNNGEKTTDIIALNQGRARITAYTRGGLRAEAEVVVSDILHSGLEFRTGDYIYYGNINHISRVLPDMDIIEREDQASPILWKFMGEETIDGKGDGYLSLFSKYVIDARRFSESTSIYHDISNNGFPGLTIKNYLNGGPYIERADMETGEIVISEYTGPMFSDNFSQAELNASPLVTNEIPLYDYDENYVADLSYTVRNERFYLPWMTQLAMREGLAYNLYWSANKDLGQNNSYAYRIMDPQNNSDMVANYKNKKPAAYWTETMISDFALSSIINIGTEMAEDRTETVPYMGMPAARIQGIRPGMKIDPQDIVFAYEINNSGKIGSIRPDNNNYILVDNDDARYFKLTVLGADSGYDVGYLDRLERDYSIASGEDLKLSLKSHGDFDLLAYKIVDENERLVKYGEEVEDDIRLETGELPEASYKVYIWPQKNNPSLSNEAGAVSTFNLHVTDSQGAGISLSHQELILGVNQRSSLYAEIEPFDYDLRDLIWTSSDNSVVTVDLDGSVMGHSHGRATITASLRDGSGASASCQVEVVDYIERVNLYSLEEVEKEDLEDLEEEIEEIKEEIVEDDLDIEEAEEEIVEEDGLVDQDGQQEEVGNDEAIEEEEERELRPVEVTSLDLEVGDKKHVYAETYPSHGQLDWFSTDESIAYYDLAREEIVAVSEGVAIITAIAKDEAKAFASCLVKVGDSDYEPVASLKIYGERSRLEVNEQVQLEAGIEPNHASIQDLIWVSSDINVARVDQDGLVKAVAMGRANISAYSLDGRHKDSFAISVSHEEDQIRLNKTRLSLEEGETSRLRIISNNLIDDIRWSSSDEDIARVDENGLVTAISAGRATISVLVNNSIELECQVTVNSTISNIEIIEKDIEIIGLGNGQRLSILIDGQEADNSEVLWTSTNPDIVKVDDYGQISSVNGGTATIKARAKDGSKAYGSVKVRVVLVIDSIRIKHASGDVTNGNFSMTNNPLYIEYLMATILPINATDKDIKWDNSNPSVVRMTVYGDEVELAPLEVGTSRVTVSSLDGSISSYVDIEVKPSIAKIKISPEGPVTMTLGESRKFSYSVLPLGADDNLIWASNDWDNIISIDQEGNVTAHNEGSASIYVHDQNFYYFSENVTINVVGQVDNRLDIASVKKMADLKVPYGTNFKDLPLAETVEVTLEDGQTGDLNVVWSQGNYNGQLAGKYTIVGELEFDTSSIINTKDLKALVNIIVAEKPGPTPKPDPNPEPGPDPKPVPKPDPKPEEKPEEEKEPEEKPEIESPKGENFNDIANHWARKDIEYISGLGLVNGDGQGSFKPEDTMTRGMVVTVLGRYSQVNISDYSQNRFTDVGSQVYYAPYIEWAAEKGIVNGIGGAKFAPDMPVTREQMVVILINYIKTMGIEINSLEDVNVNFTDADTISSWAKEAVEAIKDLGIINGKADGRFDPQGIATRAEVVTMLAKLIRRIEK